MFSFEAEIYHTTPLGIKMGKMGAIKLDSPTTMVCGMLDLQRMQPKEIL